MNTLITLVLFFVGLIVAINIIAFAGLALISFLSGISAVPGTISADIKEFKELVIWHINQRKNPPAPWEKKNF